MTFSTGPACSGVVVGWSHPSKRVRPKVFSIIPEGAAYREFVLLKDGRGVLLRIAFAEDIDRVSMS